MTHPRVQAIALPRGGAEAVLATNKVIRNTYMLLSITLLFAALVAAASVALRLPHPGIIITLVGYFGLLFAITKFRDSGLGVGLVFALTGFMGYTLGPIISHYLGLPNGTQTVMTATYNQHGGEFQCYCLQLAGQTAMPDLLKLLTNL